jgi:hypothetical protein
MLNKYLVATAVGGWTGQPEVTYENHDTIEAKNEKEAVEIYNKKHKCNYCYGHVLSQVKEPTHAR